MTKRYLARLASVAAVPGQVSGAELAPSGMKVTCRPGQTLSLSNAEAGQQVGLSVTPAISASAIASPAAPQVMFACR